VSAAGENKCGQQNKGGQSAEHPVLLSFGWVGVNSFMDLSL
jgi:hypothetical protein